MIAAPDDRSDRTPACNLRNRPSNGPIFEHSERFFHCNANRFWPTWVCACDARDRDWIIRKLCAVLKRAATPLDQPRAIGRAMVSSKTSPRGSVIGGLRQAGALKLLFPRRAEALEAIVINTAGGITGGDRFDLEATAGAGSTLTITTQAAERAYRAQPGQIGRFRTQLRVDAGATLNWLPQETILYENASFSRSLCANLTANARFLMVEPVLFGRKAMGENLHSAMFRDHIDIRRDGHPLYRDGLRLDGDIAATLDRPGVAGGARAMASLVWIAPEARGALDTIRDLIGRAGGASMVREDVMVLRLLGEDGFALRRCLVPVLDRLTRNTLPQSWRL